MDKNIINMSENAINICYYIDGDKMNRLNLIIYNNDEKIEYNDIAYYDKLNAYHFIIDGTNYYLYPNKKVLKYKADKTNVKLDFNEKKATIILEDYSYKLSLEMVNSSYLINGNEHKLKYILESEPTVKKTILITFK